MKKKIEYLNLDSALAKWIYEKLRLSNMNSSNSHELMSSLKDLMDGQITSLMLEIEESNSALSFHHYLEVGHLVIDPKLRKVTRDHIEISLTPKEFDILYFLAQNRGEVFTKKQIYQAVWEDDYMLDDSNIMAFIRKLRKKIEPNPDDPEYILTIWGFGYKFNEKI